MRTNILLKAILTIIFSLLAYNAIAQNTRTVRISVQYADENPAVGIFVSALVAGKELRSGLTNLDGIWETEFPSGEINIVATMFKSSTEGLCIENAVTQKIDGRTESITLKFSMPGLASIRGRVTTSNGQVPGRTLVRLRSDSHRFLAVKTTYTDSEGFYQISGLPANTFYFLDLFHGPDFSLDNEITTSSGEITRNFVIPATSQP